MITKELAQDRLFMCFNCEDRGQKVSVEICKNNCEVEHFSGDDHKEILKRIRKNIFFCNTCFINTFFHYNDSNIKDFAIESSNRFNSAALTPKCLLCEELIDDDERRYELFIRPRSVYFSCHTACYELAATDKFVFDE